MREELDESDSSDQVEDGRLMLSPVREICDQSVLFTCTSSIAVDIWATGVRGGVRERLSDDDDDGKGAR